MSFVVEVKTQFLTVVVLLTYMHVRISSAPGVGSSNFKR